MSETSVRSLTEPPGAVPSAPRNLHLRTSKQAPGCRQLSNSGVIRALLCSAPDGDQHGYDHDGSGGMRKSGQDVDDAGDASNTEIGHVPTCLLEPDIAITRCVRSCRIGLSRAKRESGGTLAGSQTDPRLEQCRCNAKPDLRYRARAATIALCQPAAGIAPKREGLSPRRVEKRHSFPSSLWR